MFPRMARGDDSVRAPRLRAHCTRPVLASSAVIFPLSVVANTIPSMYAGEAAASVPMRFLQRALPVFVFTAHSSPAFVRNQSVSLNSTGWYSISEWVLIDQIERNGGLMFFASAAGR